MNCSVIFSSKAAEEFQESYVWYEGLKKGLGLRFIEILDNAIDLIKGNPEGFPKKKDLYREAVVKKFPFIIVYEYVAVRQVVFILHIFHTKRHPKIKYRPV
jgi:plasmid stabilization system protein ParE